MTTWRGEIPQLVGGSPGSVVAQSVRDDPLNFQGVALHLRSSRSPPTGCPSGRALAHSLRGGAPLASFFTNLLVCSFSSAAESTGVNSGCWVLRLPKLSTGHLSQNGYRVHNYSSTV